MSETLYQRMNPVAVLFGSSVRPFTFSTCWENKWIPQPYFDDNLSICSIMQSSVPWGRSRNGDTTTICKQASICLSVSYAGLSDRKASRKFRYSEEYPKHQPKIRVHDEVLVSTETVKAHWEDQQKSVEENRKPDWKPNRSFQILGRSPRGTGDCIGQYNPQEQAYNPKLDDQLAIAAFHTNIHRRSMHNMNYVLHPQGSGSNSIAIRPAWIVKRRDEIMQWIFSGSKTELTLRTVRGKGFGVDR